MSEQPPEPSPGQMGHGEPPMASIPDSNPSYTLGVGDHVYLEIRDKSLIVVQDAKANTKPKSKPTRTCAGICSPGELLYSTTTVGQKRPLTKRGPCEASAARSPKTRSIPLYNILWAELSQDQTTLTIDFAEEASKTQLRVAQLTYPTKPPNDSGAGALPTTDTITAWTETLLTAAYGPASRRKRAYVLINPHAGPGRAQTQWTQEVAPLFAAARMPTTVHTTTRSGEAVELARTMDIDAFDIIVPCGGDGGPHELFRGLGARPDARRALATVAVAHVPCGSGNALACNTLGTPKAGPAALAIVKGVATPLDLVSITQGETRSLSFLSQTLGVMAEADLGTEHLRWMGEHRFTYGTVKQVLKKKEYACDLWVKMEIETKEAIRAHYRRERENSADKMTTTSSTTDSRGGRGRGSTVGSEASAAAGVGLPPLKYGTVAEALPEGWVKVDADHVGTFFTGNMAWMAPDVNFFTAAHFSDGFLDVYLVDGNVPAAKVPGLLLSCQNNSFFDHPLVKYFKVSAYRIVPKYNNGTPEGGLISIDGEKAPFAPFQAEVHQGLGLVITKTGRMHAPGPKGWENSGV